MSTKVSERTASRRRAPAVATVEHPSVAERQARGKAIRGTTPRRALADWTPAADRFDPVAVLEQQAETRVPELVPIRYGRMLVSPFTFFRGAAALMAADLADAPSPGLQVQLCGDAHLSNFGLFAAPDRRLVFGLNDFDETLPGPFEWDLKRLAASFAVAGRDIGLDVESRAGVTATVSRAYREAMREFAAMRNLDLWAVRMEVDELEAELAPQLSSKMRKRGERTVAKARTKDSLRAFSKLTRVVDGEPRIISDPPLIVPIEELVASDVAERFDVAFHDLIRGYRRTLTNDRRRLLERYRYIHAARKVVGVGSVGTRAWIALLQGRDGDDPLFLQAKEAEASVLEPHLGKSEFGSHGQRVVEGQRLMQAASDIMLGWLTTEGIDGVRRSFYVRQLWDQKGSAQVEDMEPETLTVYARLCGSALAKAHARSGDPIAIAAYLGRGRVFDEALATFAERYADQNERDYAALQDAAAAGRIEVQSGL